MNLLLRKIFGLSIVGFVLVLIPAFGQTKLADPITPVTKSELGDLGIFIGFGSNWQSGQYFVDCQDCIFEGGQGAGLTFGFLGEKKINDIFQYGLLAQIDSWSMTAKFTELEGIKLDIAGSDQQEYYPILFEHTSEFDLNLITFAPYFKITPVHWAYFRLGFGLGFPLSSNLKHVQNRKDYFVINNNGDTLTIVEPPLKSTLEDGSVDGINSPQLTLMPALGFNLYLGRNFWFSPVFQFTVPLSEIHSFGNEFKINTFRFFAELRYTFGDLIDKNLQ